MSSPKWGPFIFALPLGGSGSFAPLAPATFPSQLRVQFRVGPCTCCRKPKFSIHCTALGTIHRSWRVSEAGRGGSPLIRDGISEFRAADAGTQLQLPPWRCNRDIGSGEPDHTSVRTTTHLPICELRPVRVLLCTALGDPRETSGGWISMPQCLPGNSVIERSDYGCVRTISRTFQLIEGAKDNGPARTKGMDT